MSWLGTKKKSSASVKADLSDGIKSRPTCDMVQRNSTHSAPPMAVCGSEDTTENAKIIAS